MEFDDYDAGHNQLLQLLIVVSIVKRSPCLFHTPLHRKILLIAS